MRSSYRRPDRYKPNARPSHCLRLKVMGTILFIFAVAMANLLLGFVTAWMFGVGPDPTKLLLFLTRSAKNSDTAIADATELDVEESAIETAEDSQNDVMVDAFEMEDASTGPDDLTEVIVREFHTMLTLSRKRVSELDTHLRQDEPEGGGLEEVHASIFAIKREEILDDLTQFESSLRDNGTYGSELGETLQPAVAELLINIELAIEQIKDLDAAGHETSAGNTLELPPEDIGTKILDFAAILHQLQVTAESSCLKMLSIQPGLDAVKKSIRRDAERELPNYYGLRARYDVVRGNEGKSQMVAAILEVDHLRQLNVMHSLAVVDHLMVATSQLVRSQLEVDDVAGLAGQRLIIFSHARDAKSMLDLAEHLRQGIESTHFTWEGGKAQLTISAAVATAEKNEDFAAFEEKLIFALKEAKSFGANRTFLYEEVPVLVIPPSLNLGRQLYPITIPTADALAIA